MTAERAPTIVEQTDAWLALKKAAKEAAAAEMAARLALFRRLIPKPKEGTNNCELEDGRKLSFVQGYNYKVDEKLVATVKKALGAKLAKALFKVKHSLNIRPYRKCTPDQVVILAGCVSSTPGSVQVKVSGEPEDAEENDTD